jgi:hypothetical protein
MVILFKICCASGTLSYGSSADFLVAIANAREIKREWAKRLPNSTLRVQFFYPNGNRAPSEAINAALRALENSVVADAVVTRRDATSSNPPAHSEARTAGFDEVGGRSLASAVDLKFCQAGVVAPPDSPDLGNSIFFLAFGRYPVISVCNPA